MPIEIEQKFHCDALDRVRAQLAALGGRTAGAVEQVDRYYRHPARDFAATDEAFRLRRVGLKNFLTYKGPKIDAHTKSRFEQEAPLADGAAAYDACDEILRRLSFAPVAEVRKRREAFHVRRDGVELEIALDAVDRVGQFVEIEIVVDDDAPGATDAARAAVADLAAALGLAAVERRSYLELLLSAE